MLPIPMCRSLIGVIVIVLAFTGAAYGEAIRSIEEFLVNDGELPFTDARNRIAMFTFEDPDDTRLGDAMAFLASKRVLFDANVGSLAIILFEQGLSPDDSGLGYFEKVDKLTADHDFIAALWGHIARDGDDLVVDTFVQLYPERFRYRFRVGGLDDRLRARLTPSRIWVQSLRFPVSQAEAIHTIADSVRTLREGPDLQEEPVPGGYLKQGTTYRVTEREGNWSKLMLVENDVRGWTSVDAQCGADSRCTDLIAGASFLNDLLRFANGRGADVQTSSARTTSVEAVSTQVSLLELLEAARREGSLLEEVIETTSEWIARTDVPGKATFANLRAVARLRSLEQAGNLSPQTAQPVTDELARVSLDDPGNADLLHNLAVLFRFLGDDEKSRLAGRLYEEQIARSGR